MDKINLDELLGRSTKEETSIEEKPVQETTSQQEEAVQEKQDVEKPVVDNQQEQIDTTIDKREKPVDGKVEGKPIEEEKPVDTFPSERFGGKFKNWDEVNEALNKEPEVSYKDEFIKKVVDKYNEQGSLKDFFKAYSTDWKDMAHEEVLKAKFKEENGDLDNKTLDFAWKKQISKYGDPELFTTPDDDLEDNELMEKKYALAMMRKDAENVRAEKIKEQESLLEPSGEPKKEEPEYKFEDIKKKVINDFAEVKQFLDSKKITYKIGDSDVNIEVTDPDKIVNTLADERILINEFIKDGKVDTKGWSDMVNYYYNGDKVRQALVDHGKSLARSEIIDEDYKNTTFKKNPSNPVEHTDKARGLAEAILEKRR